MAVFLLLHILLNDQVQRPSLLRNEVSAFRHLVSEDGLFSPKRRTALSGFQGSGMTSLRRAVRAPPAPARPRAGAGAGAGAAPFRSCKRKRERWA